MKDTDRNPSLFTIDEYGRTKIENKEILELISGAGSLLAEIDDGSCNKGCGSNGACANINCK